MMKILEEKENLMKQTAGNKMTTVRLQEHKAKAKEQAKHCCELQNELTLLNLALQMNLQRYSYEKILTDIIDTKRNNEERIMQLEELFNFKQQLEKQLLDLKEKSFNYPQIEVPLESEECIRIKNKIAKTKEAINRYKRMSEQSFFCKKRSQLLLELNACIAQRDELVKKCDSGLVLQTMKQNKEQIRELKEEKKQIEQDLQRLKSDNEIIAAIESTSATNQISVDPQKISKEIDDKEFTIQACLDYLLLKNDKQDVFFDISPAIHIKTTESFLQHINKLQSYLDEYQKQLDDLLQKKGEIKKWQNVEEAIDLLSEKGMQMEERKRSLQINLATLTTSVEDLKERLKNNTQLLEQDQRYVELRQIDEDLKQLLEGNSELETLISEGNCDGSETVSKEIDELVKEYNQKLIGRLKDKLT